METVPNMEISMLPREHGKFHAGALNMEIPRYNGGRGDSMLRQKVFREHEVSMYTWIMEIPCYPVNMRIPR